MSRCSGMYRLRYLYPLVVKIGTELCSSIYLSIYGIILNMVRCYSFLKLDCTFSKTFNSLSGEHVRADSILLFFLIYYTILKYYII